MPTSVDDIYQFTLRMMKKNQAGGLPSETFERLWHDSQCSYQDDLLGRFQANNTGKTNPNTGLLENETILQKLSPFTKTATLTIASGQANKPTDFVFRLALRINGYDVHKIRHSQIDSVNHSTIDAPNANNNLYYLIEYEGFYKFLPSTVTTGVIDYIEQPRAIKWGFTFDVDDRQVYNPGTSIQPQWDGNSCREITKRMMKVLGVAYKDSDFASLGQSVIQTGS